jgi:hypothetical protein
VAYSAHRPGTSRLRRVCSVSPAAPYRTVHAVLPHTALRHRSSSGMRRSPVTDGSFEPVDAQPGQPVVVEPAGPEPVSGGVLDAGQLGQPPVHVAVDSGELPGGIAVAEVGPSAPQHGVEVADDVAQVAAGEAGVGAVTDLGSDRAHCPCRRPPRQVTTTTRPLRHRLAVMEPQEVEAILTTTEVHDAGLVGMQAQPRVRPAPPRSGGEPPRPVAGWW